MELSINNGAEGVPNNMPVSNPANEPFPLDTSAPKAKKKKCSAMYAASMWRSTTANVDPHRRHNGFSNKGSAASEMEP